MWGDEIGREIIPGGLRVVVERQQDYWLVYNAIMQGLYGIYIYNVLDQ